MAYQNSFGYNPFYRSDPPFHPPTSLPSFNEYILRPSYEQLIFFIASHKLSSLSKFKQCPIGYSLGLGQNQFNFVFQKSTSEPYPSDFNLECWNYFDSAWD